jgi:DNA-binding NarL/FixJ family response regulator
MLTRQERERFVLELYNQGKSTHEIAEEPECLLEIQVLF